MCTQLAEKKPDILDLSFEEIMQQPGVEIAHRTGEDRIWRTGDFGWLSKRLIKFMDFVLYSKGVPFHVELKRNRRKVTDTSPLASYFKCLHHLMSLRCEHQTYSPDFELFFECFRSHPTIGHCVFQNPAWYLGDGMCEAEIFNDFVDNLRCQALVKNTKKRMADWKAVIKSEKKSIRQTIAKLSKFSKILGVRVDMGYTQFARDALATMVRNEWEIGDATAWSAKRDARLDGDRSPENRARIDAEVALQDRANFFANQRGAGKNVFENMIGYVMKMERSDDGPLHFHCIFFFDGQKLQSVKYIVKKIEAYWKVITERRGYVHNCHINPKRDELEKADKWVVGKIRGNDKVKLGQLTRYVTWYFAKDEQRVRAKPKVKSRLLTMGLMKKKKKKKGLGGPERRRALRNPISL